MKQMLYACLVVLWLLCVPVQAQSPQHADEPLSTNAFASLLTCGPGQEFYTTFGHTALRICDTTQGLDMVYNYGMFSFDEPHFYLKFALGDLNYFLGSYPFEHFRIDYAFNGRSLYEQPLLLSHAEVNKLYRLLEHNLLPDNRHYAYDYFADNCATRVRDMVDSALICRALPLRSGNIATHPVRLVDSNANGLTLRQMMYRYTTPHLLWWQLGCDLLLGAEMDKGVAPRDYLFLPDELRHYYDTATTAWQMTGVSDSMLRSLLPDSNDTRFYDTTTAQLYKTLALNTAETQLLRDEQPERKPSFPPATAFWILCGTALLLDLLSLMWQKHRYNRGKRMHYSFRLLWFDGVLFGIAGVLGALLLFMWFGTAHYWTANNWNLLWCNPLYLILLFRLRRNNRVVAVALLLCLAAAMALGCTGLLPQHYNAAVLPLCALLAYRTLYRLGKA